MRLKGDTLQIEADGASIRQVPGAADLDRKAAGQHGHRMRLLDYAHNVYSQSGEDGVLAKIVESLPTTDRWCVEFGAFDGQHLSNTLNLSQTSGYSSVLIEADAAKFKKLETRFASHGNVIPINAMVGFGTDDNLDRLLEKTPIPKDFDVLSIDIDGNDYHVWNALAKYTPKVVCIEFNPTIPNEVTFIQEANPELSQGSSAKALVELGQKKGYELACVTHNNGIFVRADLFHVLDIPDNDLRTLREDLSAVTYFFCGYDGTLFVTGREFVSQHGYFRIKNRLRQLPRLFRDYPPRYGPLARVSYKFYRRFARLIGHA